MINDGTIPSIEEMIEDLSMVLTDLNEQGNQFGWVGILCRKSLRFRAAFGEVGARRRGRRYGLPNLRAQSLHEDLHVRQGAGHSF